MQFYPYPCNSFYKCHGAQRPPPRESTGTCDIRKLEVQDAALDEPQTAPRGYGAGGDHTSASTGRDPRGQNDNLARPRPSHALVQSPQERSRRVQEGPALGPSTRTTSEAAAGAKRAQGADFRARCTLFDLGQRPKKTTRMLKTFGKNL